MLCLLGAGFLTGQQINGINVFFVKYDVLVFVPPHVHVMYRNILASLIVNCSRVYKARPTACLTYFHLRRTSVVCVLEDMVTSFPYVSIVFAKTLLFPGMARCLFYFCHCYLQCKKVKVKFSHTRYRALGPELIPVYRQSARR